MSGTFSLSTSPPPHVTMLKVSHSFQLQLYRPNQVYSILVMCLPGCTELNGFTNVSNGRNNLAYLCFVAGECVVGQSGSFPRAIIIKGLGYVGTSTNIFKKYSDDVECQVEISTSNNIVFNYWKWLINRWMWGSLYRVYCPYNVDITQCNLKAQLGPDLVSLTILNKMKQF